MSLTTTIQIRASDAFKARLDRFADAQGMSVTAVVQAAIIEYLNRHEASITHQPTEREAR